jgi:hypothetical protein
MKIELSKREIEIILEFMDAGITFMITHQNSESCFTDLKREKERININNLMKRLKEVK